MIAIRHSPTAAAEHGKCYGVSEVALKYNFVEAADLVLEHLPDGFSTSRIFTSDLFRCESLARELSSRIPRKAVPVDPRLQEIHFGEWEGQFWSDLEKDETGYFWRWTVNWKTERPPRALAESAADLEARVRDWFSEYTSEVDGAVLIRHAGPIRVLRQIADPSITWDDAMARKVPHLRPIYLELCRDG